MAAAAGSDSAAAAAAAGDDGLEPAPVMLQCVMLGAVDSGKSTLFGTMLARSGDLDRRTIEKHARAAEELGKVGFGRAFLVDRLKAERERGVSINPLTFGRVVPAGGALGLDQSILVRDTPGHIDFTKNLLRQCVASDVGILVVPFKALSAVGVSMQRVQHQLIAARAIGVEELVIALVGEDIDVGHRSRSIEQLEQLYTDIMDELDKVLRRCGYDKCMRSISDLRDADADGGAWGTPVVVCSGLYGVHVGAEDEAGHTGAGQDCERLHAFWNSTPRPFANLAAALNRPNLGARSRLGRCPRVGDSPLESLPLRAVVTDVFKIKGVGEVATLRVVQGTVRRSGKEKPYRLLGARLQRDEGWRRRRPPPEGVATAVRSIESSIHPFGEGGPNSEVGVNIPMMSAHWAKFKWKVMAEADTGCACVNEFVATVAVVEPPPGGAADPGVPRGGPLLTASAAATVNPPRAYDAFIEGSEWQTLVGTGLAACRVKRIERVDCRSNEKHEGRDAAAKGMEPAPERGRWAVPGTTAQVTFEPLVPLAAEAFVDCPTLGRVVAFERHHIVCFGRIEIVTHGGEAARGSGSKTKAARG